MLLEFEMEAKYILVLVRHGQSTWNLENKFTGWTDVDLSDLGREEARQAGIVLKQNNFEFDIAYTSVLKRAIKTLGIVQDNMNLDWIPVVRAWQLNERHYGDLQGLNKAEMAERFGEDQVKIWRRSYDVPPPALEETDARHPKFDRRYTEVAAKDLPATESLKITLDRVLPYWHSTIAPMIKSGKKVLVAAHGNSLRALVKYLDNIPDSEITELNIPTGVPLVYELDADLKPIKHYYLGNEEAIAQAVASVASQASAKK